MQKTMKMSRLAVAVGVAGAMILSATTAVAGDFNATASVQNTLEVTNVNDMDLGTLFASEASSSGSNALELSPGGDFSTPTEDVDDTITLLSLGGAAPARGSVATDNDFTVTLPEAEITDFDAGSGGVANDGIEVRIQGGDPDVARLYLTNFRLGDVVDGAETQDTNDSFIYDIEPDFGAETVEFGIGATVATDDSGDRTEYEEAIYEGSFEVTAEF